MGFFSELKSDLSQAVNTLMPEDKTQPDSLENEATEETKMPVDIDSMLNRLDDIKLDEVEDISDTENVEHYEESIMDGEADEPEKTQEEVKKEAVEDFREMLTPQFEELNPVNDPAPASEPVDEIRELEMRIEEETMEEIQDDEPMNALEAIDSEHIDNYVAEMNSEAENTNRNGGFRVMDFDQQTPTDEISNITEGMIVKGDIATTGSIDLIGKLTGNIKCLGKLNITGEICGDSDAAEIFADSARITGEVRSKGSVKVGQSTVIVGNIFGSSAVIAGAVKGDIDVHGPVVLDTTAIVMGNIKSQSVQINNGAVIEGMCSQAYADVNPSEFFEGLKNK